MAFLQPRRLALLVTLIAAAAIFARAKQADETTAMALEIVEGDQGALPVRAEAGNGGEDEQTSWPELVGWNKLEAKKHLEETTSKRVFLVPVGSVVTMDYSTSRVRIMFLPDDKVASVPRVG